jgi:uroporphyrinogen decarboxylase
MNGQEVDRPPVSMWRHYFNQERTAEDLASAMLAHQRHFDWDFIKVNPRASYHAEPWGLKARYSGNSSPDVSSHPVKAEADWARITAVPMSHPVFREQLRALELIADGLKGRVPFLATVFTPVSIASRLNTSEDDFMASLRANSPELYSALEAVTETFTNFAKAALDRGASGLFYATTSFATTDRMNVTEYRRLVRPWDLKLLDALPSHEFTLLHVCRDNNMLGEFASYPVHAINWDVYGKNNLNLAAGMAVLQGKAVVGGIPKDGALLRASPAQMYGHVQGLTAAMGTKGFMVAAGCTYTPEAQTGNIDAVRRAVDSP